MLLFSKEFLVVAAACLIAQACALPWDDDISVEEMPVPNSKSESKYEGQNDGIVSRIMSTLNRFDKKLNAFEERFNRSLEAVQRTTTTTTATTSAPIYYGRRGGPYMAGSSSSWATWTPWRPPTTTLSPQEKCTQAKNFLCYDTKETTCVDKAKLCDGMKDCQDGSDETFCNQNAPEYLQPTSQCPLGFVGSLVHKKCYYFNLVKKMNWVQALVDCVKRNGRLVAIHSRLEQESLTRHIKIDENWNSSFWIGATSILRNNTDTYWTSWANPNINKQWSWVPSRIGEAVLSFSEIGFSYWKEQQPDNNMGNEFCMEMWADFDWKWNDVQCAKLRHHICEVPLNG